MSSKIKKITKEEIRQLPLERFDGPIHLIDSDQKLKDVIQEINSLDICGLDTEQRPVFKKGDSSDISLLQISSLEKCYLIRTLHIRDLSPLHPFLQDGKRYKVGLALLDDIRGLEKIGLPKAKGLIDLSEVAAKLGHGQLGLVNVCAQVLGVRLSKKFKLTNWESKTLSPEQQAYAATDAWISLKIYNELREKEAVALETTALR